MTDQPITIPNSHPLTVIPLIDALVIDLPWKTPLLTSNARPGHWAGRSAPTKQVRHTTAMLARTKHRGHRFDCPVTITMVWRVPDKRIRDVGSLAPMLKPVIDGLVDANVLPADDWRHVTAETCTITLDKTNPGIHVLINPVAQLIQGISDEPALLARGTEPSRPGRP